MNGLQLDRTLTVLCQTQPGMVRSLQVLYDHVVTDIPSRHELFLLARVLQVLTEDIAARANAPLSSP